MDTSALIAALVADHQHHAIARPHLRPRARISAIVLAETYSQLRRTFAQPAASAAAILRPWAEHQERVIPTTEASVVETFARTTELDLGGNIHDALIATVHAAHGIELVTLDARQHRLALALGARSTYLLA